MNKINLRVVGAQFVAIAGPIGPSKSSLINELPGMSGQINIRVFLPTQHNNHGYYLEHFEIIYCSVSQRYQQVIAACSLRDDIVAFEDGD